MHKKPTLLLAGITAVVVFFGARSAMLALWPYSPPAVVVEPKVIVESPEVIEPDHGAEKVPEVKRYSSVAEYFRAGNPNGTTYRLGEPWIKRKSFSKKRRDIIHQENGGACQVCGHVGYLEVEHRRALMNGGGNERENLGSLCDPCHNQKTRMDKSLRRQREKLLKEKKLTHPNRSGHER